MSTNEFSESESEMEQMNSEIGTGSMGTGEKKTGQRGFAALDDARRKEIARMGGRAAHRSGNAHQFTSDEARIAGKKGGQVVSVDRDHMSRIGRRGGASRRPKGEG